MEVTNISAAGIINTIPFDFNGNTKKILDLCSKAVNEGKKILLLPELSLCGYGCGDMFAQPEFAAMCVSRLLNLKYQMPEGLILGVGLAAQGTDRRTYDAYAFVKKGHVFGISAVLSFNNGRDGRIRNLNSAGGSEVFVVGTDLIKCTKQFDLDGIITGVYFNAADTEFVKGSDLVVVPTAERFELGSASRRELLTQALSIQQECTVVAPNLAGCESGADIFDGQAIIADKGEVVAKNSPLPFSDTVLVTKESGIKQSLPEYDSIVRAVALGQFDWMRKTRSHGFALSLSGGADSGLVATCVCYGMLAALEDMGFEAFKAQLEALKFKVPDLAGDPEAYIKKEIMPQILTTVYQASDVSGSVTRTAASKLAANIGSKHYEWSIADLVKQYTSIINATTPDDPLNLERDDLTLQNIQARSRAPGIWMIANRYNKLLMSTCNASEDAVGYCTMDGDTAGGLSPIGGISKSRILKINSYIAEQGLKINDSLVLHVPDMSYIAVQAPTAELRPGQTDERDLMPYVILDRIHYLSQNRMLFPRNIADTLKEEFSEFSEDDLREFVRRYFRRLAVNQWKRERGAVSFHIEHDDLASGSGFVFPVLNDGFNSIYRLFRDFSCELF